MGDEMWYEGVQEHGFLFFFCCCCHSLPSPPCGLHLLTILTACGETKIECEFHRGGIALCVFLLTFLHLCVSHGRRFYEKLHWYRGSHSVTLKFQCGGLSGIYSSEVGEQKNLWWLQNSQNALSGASGLFVSAGLYCRNMTVLHGRLYGRPATSVDCNVTWFLISGDFTPMKTYL